MKFTVVEKNAHVRLQQQLIALIPRAIEPHDLIHFDGGVDTVVEEEA